MTFTNIFHFADKKTNIKSSAQSHIDIHMAKAECGPRSMSSQGHAVDTMLNRPNAVCAV